MSLLPTNLKHLRKQHTLTQEQLAAELEINRPRLGAYEEGRAEPSVNLLIQIATRFDLTVDALVRNDLSKTDAKGFIPIGQNRILFPVIVNQENEDLIEVVGMNAAAGYLTGYADPEYIEELPKMNLPFMPSGKHRAFPIRGDSMLPIQDGSFVVGRFVENMEYVRDGKTYVVVSLDEGIVYKRVYNRVAEDASLLLVSDNKAYAPYKIHIKEVMEIWEFVCNINTQEYAESELNTESIMAMLRNMHVELKSLKKPKL